MAINSYYGPQVGWTNNSVRHWTDAEIIQYNNTDIYLNDTYVLLNYFIVCPTCFFVDSGGAYIEAMFNEGNYSPIIQRGPTDPIVGLDFGIVNSNNEGGVQESDTSGEVHIKNLDSDHLTFIPEIPGIHGDTLLKNITVNLMDSISLKIIVDSNLIRLDLLTSLKRGKKGPNLKLSPNPTKDIVNVNTNLYESSIEIHDVNGRLQKKERVNGLNSILDLSKFKNGVYFITVKNDEKWTTKPLIKK